MDDERPTPEAEGDEQTRVRIDPRFDDETRRTARTVVPLDHQVREQPSPAARQIARQRAVIVLLFVVVLILLGAVVYLLQSRYGATPVTPITQPPPTVEPTATPTPTLSPSPSV